MKHKEKYPIGSQWETRDGNRAVVVEHSDKHNIEVWISMHGVRLLGVRGNWSEVGEHACDLIKPWKEKEVKEFTLLWYKTHDGIEFVDLDEVEMIRPNVIARKTITITEGEGMGDVLEEE